MRILFWTFVCVLFALADFAPTAQAQSGRPGPVITSVAWEADPVVGQPAVLLVEAVDPHGVITELQVMFGNSIVFAHTYCVQGDEPGTPVRMRLDTVYEEPGEYTVVVRALSKPSCRARGGYRYSQEIELPTLVQ